MVETVGEPPPAPASCSAFSVALATDSPAISGVHGRTFPVRWNLREQVVELVNETQLLACANLVRAAWSQPWMSGLSEYSTAPLEGLSSAPHQVQAGWSLPGARAPLTASISRGKRPADPLSTWVSWRLPSVQIHD